MPSFTDPSSHTHFFWGKSSNYNESEGGLGLSSSKTDIKHHKCKPFDLCLAGTNCSEADIK